MSKGYITAFPTYNAVNDGEYLEDWQAVVKRLDAPVLLDITAEEYKNLKKTDAKKALALKFRAGGYEAGECPEVNGKPSRAKGVPRPTEYNVIVLDADENVSGKFDALLEEALAKYEYYSHATISSTEEALRRRVLIPTAKPVDIDTREAIIRYIADKVGIESIDRSSIKSKQMMCFPVHTSNGDKYHYHHAGELLTTEDFLPTNWKNVENWPRWKDEKIKAKSSKRIRRFIEETGEWLPYPDKNRIHDAYNRTYRASDILKKYGYTQTEANRWSHARHAAQGGIKVTNDSIIYSYYGTDPLSVERDLDAYEASLILEYGDIDNKKNWQAMLTNASKDEAVRKTLLESLPVSLPPEAETWALLYDESEEGLAQRALAFYPHKIRNGRWWRYQNGIYKEVKDQAMLPDALQIIRIAAALQPDSTAIQEMIGKVNTARNILKAWQGLASQQEDEEEWDKNLWYLNFTDCTIDLEAYCKGTPYILEHSPEYRITESTGYSWKEVENYDPKALDEVVKNIEIYLPNKDIRKYFQRAVGRSLTAAAAAEDKCIWMLGPDGGNGKSTLLNAIKGALGSYFYEMQGKYLYYSNRDRDAEAPSPELSGMKNKRIVNFCEYNGIRTLDSEKYKNYTSAGYIKARRLQSNSDSFRATCCCFLDCNGMPGLQSRDKAILRRTRVVPFFTKLNGDTTIKNRWLSDRRIHVATLVWMLLGLKDWYNNGQKLDDGLKDTPAEVYTETTAWIQSFDDPADFFEDFYEITNDEDDYLIADEAWETYQSQIYDKGATRHAFRQAEERWLRNHGITHKGKRRINNYGLRRMCYLGVKLTGTYESTHYSSGKWNHIDLVVDNTKDEEEEEKKPIAEQGGLSFE